MRHKVQGTATGSGGRFDPRDAAALLSQTTQQARRQFEPAQPWLLAVRAVLVLAALGAVWLTGTAGITGKSRFTPVEIAVMAASWAVSFVIMAAHGVTHDNQSGYLLTVPLIVVGLAYAAVMAVRADWRSFGTRLGVAVTGAVGASVGQAGAWGITAAGLGLTLLGSAAVIAWQLRRA